MNRIRANTYWCGDVKYNLTGNLWSYVAVVLDLFGRKLVVERSHYNLIISLIKHKARGCSFAKFIDV
jgi:putative transposase